MGLPGLISLLYFAFVLVLLLVLESRKSGHGVHKNRRRGVYLSGMKSSPQAGPVCRMLALWLLAAVLVWMGWHRPESPARVRPRTVDNNPSRFRLWGTSTSFTYTFTYDPHAADVWLFEAGGGRD